MSNRGQAVRMEVASVVDAFLNDQLAAYVSTSSRYEATYDIRL